MAVADASLQEAPLVGRPFKRIIDQLPHRQASSRPIPDTTRDFVEKLFRCVGFAFDRVVECGIGPQCWLRPALPSPLNGVYSETAESAVASRRVDAT